MCVLALPLVSPAWSPLLPGSHRPCYHIAYIQSGPAPQRSDPHPIVHLHLQTHRSVSAVPRSQHEVLQSAYGDDWWITYVSDRRKPHTRPRRAATMAMSAAAAPSVDARWHEVLLSPASEGSPGELVERGDAVLCVPNAVTPQECSQLTAEASASALRLRQARFETGLDPEGRARLPTIAAAARAAAAGTPCAAPLSSDADAVCRGVLLRMMRLIDAELPSLGEVLFGGARLAALLEADELGAAAPAQHASPSSLDARPSSHALPQSSPRASPRSTSTLLAASSSRTRTTRASPCSSRSPIRASSRASPAPATAPRSRRACAHVPTSALRTLAARLQAVEPASGRRTRAATASRRRRPCCGRPPAPRCSSAATCRTPACQ